MLNVYNGSFLYSIPEPTLDAVIAAIDAALAGKAAVFQFANMTVKQKQYRTAGLVLPKMRRITGKSSLLALRQRCEKAKTESVDYGTRFISATVTGGRTLNPVTGQWVDSVQLDGSE